MPSSAAKAKRVRSTSQAKGAIKKRKTIPPEEIFSKIEFINVGPQKQVFGIHRGLLCNLSSYFNAALNGEFKEAAEGVTLTEDDPITFQMFNLWLYSGQLLSQEQKRLPTDDLATLLVDACLFADVRGVPNMYNKAIDLLIRKVFCFEDNITTRPVRRVWENTLDGSGLRQLYIDVIVREGDVAVLLNPHGETSDDFSKAAIRDIAIACWWQHRTSMLGSEHDFWTHRCNYHIHEPGEYCRPDGSVGPEENDSSCASSGSDD